MPRLSWLHLTDLHFGLSGQAPLWPNVKQAFFDDLARLLDRTGPWQVVLFSGDFVQQGTKAEFEKLDEQVLAPLWARMKELGSEPYLLAVPGNHDLIRPEAKNANAALKQLLRPDRFGEIADDLFNDPRGEYGEILSAAFAEYSAWWRRTPYRHLAVREGLLPGEFSVSLEIEDVRIGVVGLNTTFLQLAGGDFTGRLAWDVRQFHAAATGDPHGDGPGWVRQHDVCLLMTHQGPEWLDKNSRESVYPEINPAGRFVVHLFGHMHENVTRGSSFNGGEMLWQWQGNSLFGLEKFGEPPTVDRRHGYSAGTIEFSGQSASLRQWPRKAVFQKANGWNCVADGEGFQLLSDEGTKTQEMAVHPLDRSQPASVAVKNVGLELAIGERQVLAAYAQAARKLWDIVDLAGLPEDDRHLAMQQFLLRQLFVPLRLTVETPALEELSDEVIEQLEQRRLQKRMSEAGRGGEQADNSPTEKFSIGQRLSPVIVPPKKRSRKQKKESDALKVQRAIPRVVILGDPGGGKTTLLRWLATGFLMRHTQDADFAKLPDVKSLPPQNWLPVLVRCRDLDKTKIATQQITIDDVLRQMLCKLELRSTDVETLVTLFRKLLERGEVLLLLDGLDEIADPQLRTQFCSWIETVAAQFPSPLVATSRIVGYREMKRRLRGGFEHATLADLGPADKDEFIRRWCEVTILDRARRETEVEKLTQAVHGRQSDRIERLTGNPMLLTTLALVQRKVGKLPSKRHKLYWEAVGVLLNWRADVDEPLDPDEALPQLEYVAYAMCDRGVQRLRRDELLALLEDVRRDYPHIRPVQQHSPTEFLAQLERRTGLLVETGHEQHDGRPVPVYEFRHLTFQEYLAALALVEGRFPGHDPKNSLAERVAPLAGRLVEVRREFQVSENWREALRLCVACCNDDDVDSTLSAILVGQATAPGAAADIGGTGLADQREARPRAILAALCLADEPNVSQPTALAVMQSFAAQIDERDGGGKANSGLSQAAMELAHSVWCDPLQTALVREFKSRPAETREKPGSLAGMVGGISLPDADQARQIWLRDHVTRITGNDIDSALIAALAVMNVAYQGKAQLAVSLIDGLIGLLSCGPTAAHATSWALFWLSDVHTKGVWTPTAPDISRLEPFLIDTTTDGQAVRFLCIALQNVRASAVVPALLMALKHTYQPARSAAASTLGKIADPSAIPALQVCLNDLDATVRQDAIEALARIRGDEAIQRLLTHDWDTRYAWLDPQVPIDADRVSKVAKKLKLPESEIRGLYEGIASDFGLTLAWQNQGPS
ncbi:MAG: NACHT domain-containing protein [Candidatus Saccharimonas sp.]|nr:NACHT domain-containing protein [Planctomycetaceae bacterium]